MDFSKVIEQKHLIKCCDINEQKELFDVCSKLGITIGFSEITFNEDDLCYEIKNGKLICSDRKGRYIWFDDIDFCNEDNVKIKELFNPDNVLKDSFTHKFNGSEFVENMNISALQGKYDKCALRDNEVMRIFEILMKKHKCNPVLIGKPGVGKTAIVEALAQKIVDFKKSELNGGKAHPFSNKTILNVNFNSMVSGSKYRGDFEEKLKNIVDYASSNPDIILFVDELHIITNLNNSDQAGTTSVGQTLKQPLSRGDICVIGATTDTEYNILTSDKALARRFMPVYVKEFTKSQMKLLLDTIGENYLDFHKIKVPKNFMSEALDYCDNYCEGGTYPDKFIDLIDETFAKARLTKWGAKIVKVTINDFVKH